MERKQNLIPVKFSNGKTLKLSAGKHNEIQAAIVHNFAARFANGGSVLYLGDIANKELFVDEKMLKELNIPVNQSDKLPDAIIYDHTKNRLFLIEAVTSHGPLSPERVVELGEFLKNCNAWKIYVTAYHDFAEFENHPNNIAWDTEVWFADVPEHIIHFNGDRLLVPR